MNFLEAAEKVKLLNNKPSDEDMLQLYGLYKQATLSDCNTSRPGFWDFVGKAKWEAWNDLKGTTSKNAEILYIDLVSKLVANE
jgi:diazepam-binding inhibitor (GABA receptor modulating acyl-CoA-binding protein)